MLNRTIEPAFGKIDSIDLLEPTVQHLSNGIPVFSLAAGVQDVLKVELVFGAGTTTSNKLLVGSSAVKLIKEGTSTKTAAEIAEAVDFYGAYLQTEVTHEESSIALFTLNKHLEKTLPVLADVYANPTYSEREFETYVLKSQQEMLVNLEKVGYLSSKAFNAALFGSSHPYGRSANADDFQKLNRNDLVQFHQEFIKDKPKYILIAGRPAKDTIDLLDKHFGDAPRTTLAEHTVEVSEMTESTVHVEKQDAVQNAIRVGRVLFNRTHPDFIGMQILSTVLGGYFGSRLMSNIREDKGYTYGVGAGLVSMKDAGYLSISTQVGSDVCQAALNEIHFEIERLRKELIPNAELELVRNYMLGTILKTVDGPFELASKWKTYMKYGLGADAHEELIHRIKTITPERLRELAQTYLQREDLKQVTAGQPLQ